MPVFQMPDVYVGELCGTPPIVGVGTSTAAFIGTVDAGAPFEMPLKPGSETDRLMLAPVETPVLITNFEQFKKHFGNFQKGNRILSHAVFGFFLNGGRRCYVVRVDDLTSIGGALVRLEQIDEISIVAAPGGRAAVTQEAIIDHCELMQDRFAILDGQALTTIDARPIQGATPDSDYAALYFPQIEVIDQTMVEVSGQPSDMWRPTPGARTFIPPSGHIAGIYARVDETRGVHKAPTNEIVRGALNLECPVIRDKQKELNSEGINLIQGFESVLKVCGASTLGGPNNGEFKNISTRRLMNFIRESIDRGTQFAAYEPNNPLLWVRIERAVTTFLEGVWCDGALFGNTPEEAFFVKCDETTNTPEVRKLGLVIIEIGIAIVKPAEFEVFRTTQLARPGL